MYGAIVWLKIDLYETPSVLKGWEVILDLVLMPEGWNLT
jgi:hypothetical protein